MRPTRRSGRAHAAHTTPQRPLLHEDTAKGAHPGRRPTLLDVARRLSLSRTTVSVVLSNSPAAAAISEKTRLRILQAAEEMNYTPHLPARSLRNNRSMSIGVMTIDLSDGYFTSLMVGVEASLVELGYFYFIVSHFSDPKLLQQYARMLSERCVEGILLVNTPAPQVNLPMVSIAGHHVRNGPPTVMLDHDHAAWIAISHLADLGHRRIAFIVGQPWSLDSRDRWEAIQAAAQKHSIAVDPSLVITLESNTWSPDIGYAPMRKLLARTRNFTAVFAFNDTAAMGVIRALIDEGLRVPQDVSVLGFDDVVNANFFIPRLSTIRQPLQSMGRSAVDRLLTSIRDPGRRLPATIRMQPELIVRESTGPAPAARSRRSLPGSAR